MSRYAIDKREKDNLQILFEALDDDKDGEVSLNDFITNYKTKFSISV